MANLSQGSLCTISDDVLAQYRKFKLRKDPDNNAFIMKIDKNTLKVEVDEVVEHTPIGDIYDYLPESVPRYVVYSYKQTHATGRVSYPEVLIFYCPREIKPDLAMMYTSTKSLVQSKIELMKSFDLFDAEELTEEWLLEKLQFFERNY